MAHPNVTFLAVSFERSKFFPMFAGKIPSNNVKWIVMEGVMERERLPQVTMPYVIDMHGWPGKECHTPWDKRKLLLFAGRIPHKRVPKWKFRQSLLRNLQDDRRVTVNAQFTVNAKFIGNAHYVAAGLANQSSPRLTRKEYVALAHAHRFCVVSPGDTASSSKLAETMVLAAEGACLPLIIWGTTLNYVDVSVRARFPRAAFESHELNYTRVASFAELPKGPEAAKRLLKRLGRVGSREARARGEAAQAMRGAFLMPQAATFSLRRFGVL